MGEYMSELPLDIKCVILSSLTVRDSFRVRSLSSSWKDLPDIRPVLHFDASTIFGGGEGSRANFIRAVDQFFKFWRAPKVTQLKLKFALTNTCAPHIDCWIKSVIGKEVEKLDLDFKFFARITSVEKYVFPCHLLHTENESHLKHLRLRYCRLVLIRDGSISWLGKLTTLELIEATLSDLGCILSACSNLESLSLISCNLGEYEMSMSIQHPSLKKLIIGTRGLTLHVQLSCPHLKTFEFYGQASFTFSNVLRLREASLKHCFAIEGGSKHFSELATNAPQIQTLSLRLTTEVPPLPPSVTTSSLKLLYLLVSARSGFDAQTITHLLCACPVLEELQLEINSYFNRLQDNHPRKQCVDRPHFHLKVFKITGKFRGVYMEELVEYMLRNCVLLELIVFIVDPVCNPRLKILPMFSVWQKINPNV